MSEENILETLNNLNELFRNCQDKVRDNDYCPFLSDVWKRHRDNIGKAIITVNSIKNEPK